MGDPPLIMTTGQFDHLAKLFQQSHAETFNQSRLSQATSGIDRADGSVPGFTRTWLRAIDGWCTEAVDDLFIIQLCKQTSSGDLLEEIRRWTSVEQGCITTWAELRKKVLEHFLSACENLKLQAMLESAQQNDGETISAYIRRFRAEATRAYPETRPPIEENRVVASFLRGFADLPFTERLFRTGKVSTLEEAISTALEKEAQRERLEQVLLKRGQEKMEVDSVDTAPTKASVVDTMQRRLEQLNTRMAKVEAKGSKQPAPSASANEPQQSAQAAQAAKQRPQNPGNKQPARRDPRHLWTADGKPICGYCSRTGHLFRECLQRRRENAAVAPTPSGGRQ